MFKSESARQQMYSHAAKGHEGSMRQVFDEIHERLCAIENGGGASGPASAPDMSGIEARLDALEAGTAPPPPAEVPLDERIAIAIRALPESAFGQNGKPKVPAIEEALGENITAADRDRVWAAMQEENAE